MDCGENLVVFVQVQCSLAKEPCGLHLISAGVKYIRHIINPFVNHIEEMYRVFFHNNSERIKVHTAWCKQKQV